jgi:hypothetical protein
MTHPMQPTNMRDAVCLALTLMMSGGPQTGCSSSSPSDGAVDAGVGADGDAGTNALDGAGSHDSAANDVTQERESACGTTVPPAARIVDAALDVWTLTSGGQIERNGVVDPVTNGVVLLIYFRGLVYQEAHNLWWAWTGGAWQDAKDPRLTGSCTDGGSDAAPPPGTRSFFVGIKVGGDSGGAFDTAEFQSDHANLGATVEAVQSYDFGGLTLQGTGFDEFGTAPAYMMSIATATSGTVKNTDIVNGVEDSGIQGMLDQAVLDHNAGYSIPVFRIMWEIGGLPSGAATWFTWQPDTGVGVSAGTGNNAANYVAAFRHIAAMVRATCPWALIDWNCNFGATDNEFYPGDDVVDIVSTDLYVQPQYQSFDPGTTSGWTQMLTGYNGFVGLTAFDAFCASTSGPNAPPGMTGKSKFMAFPEIGAGAGGPNAGYQTGAFDPAGYITKFAAWMAARGPRVAYWLWWNGNDSGSTYLGPSPGSPAGATVYDTMQKSAALDPFWVGHPGMSPP